MLVAVAASLEEVQDIQLVASTSQGTAVLPLVNEHEPDLVLLDTKLSDIDGLVVLDRLRKHFPGVKVAILDEADPRAVAAAEERGASGYISKHIDPAQLAPALRQLHAGTDFVSFGIAEWADQPRPANLTKRELSILSAVAAGKPNKQIAADLFVTEQTVKFHLTNIYRKLNLTSRTAAARYAYEHSLADSPFLIKGDNSVSRSSNGRESGGPTTNPPPSLHGRPSRAARISVTQDRTGAEARSGS